MKFVFVRLCPWLMGLLVVLLPHSMLAQVQGTPQLNFAAGVYQISPITNNNACTDVSQGSASNGTKVQAYSCNGTTSQYWSLVPVSTAAGNGFQVVSATSGSCLGIDGASRTNGALALMWQCLGPAQTSQVWQFFASGSSLQLVSLNSGKCLDLPHGQSGNGTALQQWDCGPGLNTNQLWNLVKPSSEGKPQQSLGSGPYKISPQVNGNVCIDVAGAAKADGTNIQAFACNGTSAQSWSLIPVSSVQGSGYQVIVGSSSACLDVVNGSVVNGALAHQWNCLGASQLSQVWQLFPFGSSYELVSLNSGKCLDLTTGNTASGTQLQQWSCGQGGNRNQLWTLTGTASAAAAAASAVATATATATAAATAVATAAAATAAQVATAAQSTGQQAAMADSFVDSIGVQTHLNYLPTPYATAWPQVLSELKLSGIRHIRDSLTSTQTFLAEHQQLAAAGIGALVGVPLDANVAPGILQAYASQAGDLDSIEAPNECDNGNNCGSGSLNGVANVAAFMPTLMASGHALNVPVVGPSFVNPLSYGYSPNLSQVMNYNNLHLYFGGRNPGSAGWGGADPQGNLYGSMAMWIDMLNQNGPGVPMVITESGYISYPTTNIPYTIPESVEANYKPRLLLLAFNHGFKRTYLYEFVDELAEPGFGLLRNDMSEKPALVAIKNLTGLLTDPGAAFQPGKLSYTLSGGDNTITTTLLQKRDGSFWLVLWAEQSSYEASTNTPIPVKTQNVTINLTGSAVARKTYHFDTTGAAAGSSLSSPLQNLTLPINDSLTIVQITPQ